jgi:hypothetical protein
MADASLSVRPRARDDVLFRYLDDEWVIFDPVTDRLHALNLTAALVWAECDGERDVAAIADEVASAFDPPLPRDRVLDDVRGAIEAFRDEGLLLERH